MARFAVVRVAAEDGMQAQRAFMDAFAPVTMSTNLNPPASGPEHELSVQDHSELEVRRVLERAGISVLASKEILDKPMSARFQRSAPDTPDAV